MKRIRSAHTRAIGASRKPRWVVFGVLWYLAMAIVVPFSAPAIYQSEILGSVHDFFNALSNRLLGMWGTNLVDMFAIGLFVGLCQWLILRSYVRGAYRWLVATLMGYLITAGLYSLAEPFLQPVDPTPIWIIVVATVESVLTGMIQGVCQALALRYWIKQAMWWIPLMMGVRLLNVTPPLVVQFGAGQSILAAITAVTLAIWFDKNWPDIYAKERANNAHL